MKPILKIQHLKKNYHDLDGEVCAILDINLDIYPKEIISIVGPSGCGKTSLLSILSNLVSKTDGEILFNKDNIKLGYMLQKDALFPWKTILENCLIGLEINNTLNEKTKNKVIDLLNTYGLGEFINKYPDSLSGGMRQRVVRILYTHGIITYKRLITLINKEKEVYYVIR